MRTLVIPPPAQRDENSIQMLSAWIAERGLHCTMNVGMWHAEGRDEPASWGVLLADIVRHLGTALESEHGVDAGDIAADIVEALNEELDNPTSEVNGEFHPGHS
jgi:hypothetical protein